MKFRNTSAGSLGVDPAAYQIGAVIQAVIDNCLSQNPPVEQQYIGSQCGYAVLDMLCDHLDEHPDLELILRMTLL